MVLDQIVAGAAAHHVDRDLFVALPGGDEERDRASGCFEPVEERRCGEVRQAVVDDQEVGRPKRDDGETLGGGSRLRDRDSRGGEAARDQAPQAVIVLDDQDGTPPELAALGHGVRCASSGGT